ncbi:MAG: M48 family metallopeptidase [Deltaproteobacteria bacterium]|nr:M48 family metallopeptidase [Deltaproteobacteria bacterium]
MATGFGGSCFGLEGASGVGCTVTPRGFGLEVLTASGAALTLPYPHMNVSFSGVDDKYLSFEASSGGRTVRVLVSDRGIVPAIEAVGAPGSVLEQLRGARSARKRRAASRAGVLATIAAVLATLAALVIAGLLWVIARAADAVPPSFEVELGRAAAGQILAGTPACTDPAMNRAVREIGTRLVGAMGASPYAFRVRVLDSKEVNAFALPGGYVFVNRGLLELASSGDELAGVMAHELEHVLRRHSVRNLARQAGLSLVLAAVAWSGSDLQGFLMSNAAGLASMSFSRDQEEEADARGLELMARAGLDPSGLPRFLARLEAEEGKLGPLLTFISDHPASRDRVKALDAMIAAAPRAAVKPLAARFDEAKKTCAPAKVTDPDEP